VLDETVLPGIEVDAAANEPALCEYLITDIALGSHISFLQHTFFSMWQDKRTSQIASCDSVQVLQSFISIRRK
jgi:hypothetical protein